MWRAPWLPPTPLGAREVERQVAATDSSVTVAQRVLLTDAPGSGRLGIEAVDLSGSRRRLAPPAPQAGFGRSKGIFARPYKICSDVRYEDLCLAPHVMPGCTL